MFKARFVNKSRRDLLKNLSAIGALGLSSSLCPSTMNAATTQNALGMKSLSRGEDGYEYSRRRMVFKGNTPQRYPDLIVQPGNERELIEAVKFARDNQLQVVCRASGHNTPGAVLRNGGMLINVEALNNIDVDTVGKTATVQPGVITAYFQTVISQQGLAFPSASCHTVSLTGFILGGGHGHNVSLWTRGLAYRALLSARVLLASGQTVSVDKGQYPDIYWALRGCGPAFFGVVLSMTLQLFDPIGAGYVRHYRYPIDQLSAVIRFFDKRQATQDPRLRTKMVLLAPEKNGEQPSFDLNIYAHALRGNNAEQYAKALITAYEEDGLPTNYTRRSNFMALDPLADMVTPPRDMATTTDNIYTDNAFSLLALAEHFRDKPEHCSVFLSLDHNFQRNEFPDDACYSAKGRHFLSYHTLWKPGTGDCEVAAWEVKCSDIAKQFANSHYINQLDNERYPERVKDCFSDENWKKLQSVRKKYDPSNFFYSYLGL